MARKLNPDEQEVFAQLSLEELSTVDFEGTNLPWSITQRSKTALKLSPELRAWFRDDFPEPPQR